jgi:opacity protein-like surface antigen
MRIIYPNNEDGVSVLIPAPKFLAQLEGSETEKLLHIAHKDLPTGTPFEIVEDDYVPSDRSFRNAWEYVAGADEQVSEDLSLDDQLKYNHITQEQFDALDN